MNRGIDAFSRVVEIKNINSRERQQSDLILGLFFAIAQLLLTAQTTTAQLDSQTLLVNDTISPPYPLPYSPFNEKEGGTSAETDDRKTADGRGIRSSTSIVTSQIPDWPQYHGNKMNQGTISATPPSTIFIYPRWEYSVKKTMGVIITDDGKVVFGSSQNNDQRLTVLDLESGAKLWEGDGVNYKQVNSVPAYAGGRVYYTTPNAVHYENLNNHQDSAVYTADAGTYTSPKVDDARVYVGSTDGYLTALNKTTLSSVWRYKTTSQIKNTPAVYSDDIYGRWVSTWAGACSAVCAGQGLVSITNQNGDSCMSGENVIGEAADAVGYSALLAGCWCGDNHPAAQCGVCRITSSDATWDGAYCWRPGQKRDNDATDITAACYCSGGNPAGSHGVYFTTEDGFLYSLYKNNGTLKWKTHVGAVNTAPMVYGGIVYVAGSCGTYNTPYAYAINSIDGSIIWKKAVPVAPYHITNGNAPFVVAPYIYFNLNGQIFGLRWDSGQPYSELGIVFGTGNDKDDLAAGNGLVCYQFYQSGTYYPQCGPYPLSGFNLSTTAGYGYAPAVTDGFFIAANEDKIFALRNTAYTAVRTIPYKKDNTTSAEGFTVPQTVSLEPNTGAGPYGRNTYYYTYNGLSYYSEIGLYTEESQIRATGLEHFRYGGKTYKLGYYQLNGVRTDLPNTTLTNTTVTFDVGVNDSTLWFVYGEITDGDGDGYGPPNDCNDGNASIKPGATEVCNGVDDDCDGSTDEGVKNTYYRDADGDSYGSPSVTTQACSVPSGYVSNSQDCNDGNANVKPGAVESCNNVDDDCDGSTDEALTQSQSCGTDTGECVAGSQSRSCSAGSWGSWGSCGGSYVGPVAEICDNKDNDCDGSTDEGLTQSQACGTNTGECVVGTQSRACSAGVWGSWGSCGGSYVGSVAEVCDNKDNDCDGSTDESLTRSTSCGVGRCAGNTGVETCSAGVWGGNTCNPTAGAVAETCNNVDDDCDGSTDEALTQSQSCGTDTGECVAGSQSRSCSAGSWGSWGSCVGEVGPVAEVCDNKDNDCDGSVDDGVSESRSCGNNTGECRPGTQSRTCSAGAWSSWSACGGGYVGPSTEICDSKDNDCDGSVDEGGVCSLPAPQPTISWNRNGSVTLTWTAVPNADSYKIYAVNSCAGAGGTYPLMTSGLTIASWTDVNASAYSERYYKVGVVRGGSENVSSYAVGKFDVSLTSGWNLASVPLIPANPSIKPYASSVFASLHNPVDSDFGSSFNGSYDFVVAPVADGSTVLGSFDPKVPSFLDQNVRSVSEKVAFQIRMVRDDVLTVVGRVPANSSIVLSGADWFWVGYPSCAVKGIKPFSSSVLRSLHDGSATDFGPSFDGSYDFLIGPFNGYSFLGTFDPLKPSALPQNLDSLGPGRGYILQMRRAGTLSTAFN